MDNANALYSLLDSSFRLLTDEEKEKFDFFCTLFLEKNTQINLSSIRDKKGVWEKHFFDSLLGGEILEKYNPQKVLDIGAGGGFPTLPLSLLFPQIQFFPLDSVQKKGNAILEFAKKLECKNIHFIWGRAEELGQKRTYREQFDMVTARAFAHFSPLLEMAIPFLKVNGILLAYRGPNNDKNDEKLIQYFGSKKINIIEKMLPGGEKREIWVIQKKESTAKIFPRSIGIPKKDPIVLS